MIALGSRGELSSTLGPCSHAATPSVRFTGGDRYEALALGVVRNTCRDGVVVLDIRRVARLAIDPVPSASVDARLVYAVRAFDAAGIELDIGQETPIAWSFRGALASRSYPGCGDIIPICPPMNDGFAVALGPGVGTIDASFGALHARSTTTITR